MRETWSATPCYFRKVTHDGARRAPSHNTTHIDTGNLYRKRRASRSHSSRVRMSPCTNTQNTIKSRRVKGTQGAHAPHARGPSRSG